MTEPTFNSGHTHRVLLVEMLKRLQRDCKTKAAATWPTPTQRDSARMALEQLKAAKPLLALVDTMPGEAAEQVYAMVRSLLVGTERVGANAGVWLLNEALTVERMSPAQEAAEIANKEKREKVWEKIKEHCQPMKPAEIPTSKPFARKLSADENFRALVSGLGRAPKRKPDSVALPSINTIVAAITDGKKREDELSRS